MGTPLRSQGICPKPLVKLRAAATHMCAEKSAVPDALHANPTRAHAGARERVCGKVDVHSRTETATQTETATHTAAGTQAQAHTLRDRQ